MPSIRETGILTVAAIRQPKGDGPTEYLFHERQRVFTLPKSPKVAEEGAKLLGEAYEKKAPVKVLMDARHPLIQRIDRPSPVEIEEFHRNRVPAEKGGKTMAVRVRDIDPTTFDIVDHYLKIPIFRRCTKIVPSVPSQIILDIS